MTDEASGGLGRALSKAAYILREEGALTLADRATRALLARIRRTLEDKSQNMARWQALRGRYRGQRAFLVGNGPSLNSTPMHLLRNEEVMCFNRFHLMFERLAWRPTMYAISDDRVAFDIADEVVKEVLPEVRLAFFPDIHPYNVDFRKVIPALDHVYWLYLDRLDFSDELPYAGMNKTVANVGIQVLAFLGFNPIYLVGVDMTYSRPSSVVADSARDWTSTANDDPNHFDPRYFGRGRRYHAPRMQETLERYGRARDFYADRGIEIVNAGVGGRLEVFPRVPLRSLFGGVTREQELQWIGEAVAASDSAIPARELHRLPRLETAFDSCAQGCWVPESACIDVLAEALRTHLVFGPLVDGQYLFVLRRSGPAWQ